jgi:5-methylcytosine-specific restriction endonuclease McrA
MGMNNQTEARKKYTEKRIQECLDYLGNKCVKCGSTHNLEFDHIDPKTKIENISNAVRAQCWSWKRLIIELDKCQLLCKPCHIEKTSSEQGVEHGRGFSGKKNCPCAACKARKAVYMKEYKQGFP